MGKKQVKIYTDGACRSNPGPGGWAALLLYQDSEKEIAGFESHTTNNRMELMAAIQALTALTEPCEIALITDSEYVKKGITQWIVNWKRKGWKTSDHKPVKNADLWMSLDELTRNHDITWQWVRGHSGHDGNERVDLLARRMIDENL